MPSAVTVIARPRLRRLLLTSCLGLATVALNAQPSMATTVAFGAAPSLPTLSGVTLNGQTQSTFTVWTMTNAIRITSSGTNTGWNLTVGANTSGGTKSAVFKQYCPNATCGTDTGPGYVAGGFTLPADSLTWNTSGSSWSSAAPRPAYQCSVSPFCTIDHATATKVVSASSSVALGAWSSSGSSVLTLATPANLHKLQTGEVYRVDVVWTASTGP